VNMMTFHYVKKGTKSYWCGMGIFDDWGPSGQYTTDVEQVNCRGCLEAMPADMQRGLRVRLNKAGDVVKSVHVTALFPVDDDGMITLGPYERMTADAFQRAVEEWRSSLEKGKG
jgi:hypothetical protein